MIRQKTNFAYGFSTKGFGPQEVGEDILPIFKSPEAWNTDDEGEKEVGTPVQVDLTEEFKLKVCPDGEVPDGFLQKFVGDKYPGVDDFYKRKRTNKFILPGYPAPIVIMKKFGVLDTQLLHDDYASPQKGDDIFVDEGLFGNIKPILAEVTGGEIADATALDFTGTNLAFELNGEAITLDADDYADVEDVATAINDQTGADITVTAEGDSLFVVAAKGEDIVISDATTGDLSDIGLTAGTTEPQGIAIGTVYLVKENDGETYVWIVLNEETR